MDIVKATFRKERKHVIYDNNYLYSFDSNDSSFRYSGAIYGFPLRKVCPKIYKEKCVNQEWPGLSVQTTAEGKGVFAAQNFKKGTVICNYGGLEVSEEYAESKLLPFEKKCNYLVEMNEKHRGIYKKFFLNHNIESEKRVGWTYGKFLNHSKVHPNLEFRVVVTGKDKLDVLFLAKHNICINDQLLWDYGKNYSGVNACVESCKKCKGDVL